MAVVVFVIGAMVGMTVLIFAYENQEPVTLRYLLTWQLEPIPLFAVIVASAGIGFVIASLFGLAAYLRQRKIVRQQRRTIAELQSELQSLRTLPLEVPSGPGGVHGADSAASSVGELSAR
jgi:uncharacterized integral membrane protein